MNEDRKKELMQHYVITVARWYDKVNGNTYHNVKVRDLHALQDLTSGLTYGYGRQYLVTAANMIKAHNGDLNPDFEDVNYNDLSYCVLSVIQVNTKRELKAL